MIGWKMVFVCFLVWRCMHLVILLTVEKQGRKESEKHFRCKVSETSRWSLFYNVRKKICTEKHAHSNEKAQIIWGHQDKRRYELSKKCNYDFSARLISSWSRRKRKTEGRIIECKDSRARLCRLVTGCLWPSCFAALCLSFLNC